MSKLYAVAYMREHGMDVEKFREAMSSIPAKIRILKRSHAYVIRCLSVYYYIKGQIIQEEEFTISEKNLYRLISADVRWTAEDQRDLMSDSRFIKEVEKEDLPINHYWNVCFLQRFFTLNSNTLKKVRTQYHLKELGRAESSWFQMMPKPANRHGGRPEGSKTKIPEEDHEILLDNLSRYNQIVKRYVEHGCEDKFVYMHKQLRKLPNAELPGILKMPFMQSEIRIRWYYYSLRYRYKVSIGVPKEIIDPGYGELKERAVKYGYPFDEAASWPLPC